MKKKVSFVRELQAAIGNSGQVFETANGAYAMHWMQDAPFTIIFPEELDTDEWGDIISPLEVGRGNIGSPLFSESNLVCDCTDVGCFYWCILEQESDEATYLRLCEPKDATHVFVVYMHGEMRGKALSMHDDGACSDLRFFHSQDECDLVCFLMPVGYIRLSYKVDGATRYTYGIKDQEELAQYYQERSAAWRQEAQEKLDAWRSQIDQNANAIQQAKEFKEAHKDELDALATRYDTFWHALMDFVNSADLDFRQDAMNLGRVKLLTAIDRSHGWKINLNQQKFDFSEPGIKELTEAICEQESKLEALKANQEERRRRGATMREVWRNITEMHVRIVADNGDHTRCRVNFQKIWATVNIDTATICSYNRYSVLEKKEFSLAEDRNQIFVHLRTVIAQSKEHWCKIRCRLEDVFNR